MSSRKRATDLSDGPTGQVCNEHQSMASTTEIPRLPRIVAMVVIGITIVLSAVLRFWASLDDFWLDEIWTWTKAAQLNNWLDILQGVHHDNNHYLNTFVLYAIGKD